MKLKQKKILIIVFLLLLPLLFYKFLFVNKIQLNFLMDSVMYLNNEEEYKINKLSNTLETVKKKFYTMYYAINSLGMKITGEKEAVKQSGDGYTLVLNGEQSVYHLLGTPYIDEGCSVYDENGNKIDLVVNVKNAVDVNKEGTYYVRYVVIYQGNVSVIYRAVTVYKIRCEGIINRTGTMLNVISNLDVPWVWEFDGVIVNGGSKVELMHKKVDKATVSFKDGTKVNCNIKNSLIYDFEYDSENEKPYIGCRTYDADDKTRLESILKNAVNEAGYGTRAGVVEAARFLVGGLDYKIKYTGPKQADWQIGRYPYVGLNIDAYTGWGCSIKGYNQGMDCTNFVYWAFTQAGLKVDNVYSTKNVYSLREVVDKLRVGDLLLTPGGTSFTHVGIVIGIDDSSIYVAEATTGEIDAIVVTRLDKNNLPVSGNLSKARLYEYEKEGNVTNMWVS